MRSRAINPHVHVKTETTIEEIEAQRSVGPLLLSMDSSWTPSWRPVGETVTVFQGPKGITVLVWEDRDDGGDDGGGTWMFIEEARSYWEAASPMTSRLLYLVKECPTAATSGLHILR